MIGALWHWVSTAFNTYVLHSEHGNGYQWYSGPAIVAGLFTNVVIFAVKHNCYEHGCRRLGRIHGADGHSRCKRCHRAYSSSGVN